MSLEPKAMRVKVLAKGAQGIVIRVFGDINKIGHEKVRIGGILTTGPFKRIKEGDLSNTEDVLCYQTSELTSSLEIDSIVELTWED